MFLEENKDPLRGEEGVYSGYLFIIMPDIHVQVTVGRYIGARYIATGSERVVSVDVSVNGKRHDQSGI